MAIKKTIITVHGIEVADAYHRVESVSLIGKDMITFHVRSYASTDKPFFAETVLTCSYNLERDNPITQAYAYLKTLPEYADAIDC